MADRTAYNQCMRPWMAGGGEEKKLNFCIGAKVCSGKMDEDEARKVCLENPPAPRSLNVRGQKCLEKQPAIAACLAKTIDFDNLTTANVEDKLREALERCACHKKKPSGRESKRKTVENMPPEQLEAMRALAQIGGIWDK